VKKGLPSVAGLSSQVVAFVYLRGTEYNVINHLSTFTLVGNRGIGGAQSEKCVFDYFR